MELHRIERLENATKKLLKIIKKYRDGKADESHLWLVVHETIVELNGSLMNELSRLIWKYEK